MSVDAYTVWPLDCRIAMSIMPPDSLDACVTDPPYELGFMGKGWDNAGVAFDPETWRAVYRVLKPGAHLLAFSGSRTYHRMVCAIEDAGFEIRDQIMWIYGSGFPKSLDVSKAIDKAAGAEREVVGVAGRSGSDRSCMAGDFAGGEYLSTAPATDAARQWRGWGTALKPAHEPIVVARKPLIGTVAQNVQTHGTGALNIDGCRVPGWKPQVTQGINTNATSFNVAKKRQTSGDSNDGRFPANVIHDGSDEVLEQFPQAPGQQATASTSDTVRAGQNTYGAMRQGSGGASPRTDSGTAARFFYSAKCSKRDRNEGCENLTAPYEHSGPRGHSLNGDGSPSEASRPRGNVHPTVKPTDLMRYLCRLVTPPGGTVLDPFAGSGSTGKAAVLEGFHPVLCEMTDEYLPILQARIDHAVTVRYGSSA